MIDSKIEDIRVNLQRIDVPSEAEILARRFTLDELFMYCTTNKDNASVNMAISILLWNATNDIQHSDVKEEVDDYEP